LQVLEYPLQFANSTNLDSAFMTLSNGHHKNGR